MIRGRYPWAIAAGLLLAAAFPNLGIAGLAWIAPALMVVAAIGEPGKRAFRLGFVAGLAHYLASLSWLLRIPVPWTWKWAPALGWVALSAFLSFGIGGWVWLCWKSFPGDVRPAESGKLVPTVMAERFLSASWLSRTFWALGGAAAWVAFEMIVARILGGFPWNLLGSSQFRMTPLIQIASFTGIYGVSFVAVWSSLSLLSAAAVICRKPAMRSAWVGEIILPLAAVAVLCAYGYQKLMIAEPPRPQLTVALVQPSIPQTLIWDSAGDEQRFQELLQLSEHALTNHPDLLIWPEAGVPGLLRADTNMAAQISNLANNHHVWMIIGADDATPHPNATNWADSDFFNSSFLITPNGRYVEEEEYRKRNLVMFGEYVPGWLPFSKYLTPIEGGFKPGTNAVAGHLTNLNANVSVLICFEDVFPHLARQYVADDTDFLVNLTNNGWFGEGAAQWQHAAGALFRTVENGVPLVRCSNNGLTCWIDAHGRIVSWFEDQQGRIYGPGFLMAHVPLLRPGEKRLPTFYRLHGDWFGWACVAITVVRLVGAILRTSKLPVQNESHAVTPSGTPGAPQ